MSESPEPPRDVGFATLLRASLLVMLAALVLALAAWLGYRWLA